MAKKSKRPQRSTSRKVSNNSKWKKSNNTKMDPEITNNTKMSSGSNDPSWYSKYSALAMDAGSIPYGIPTGTTFDLEPECIGDFSRDCREVLGSIPGILRLSVAPIVGVSTGYDSPVNRAAQMLYTYVRHVNAGHANYDPNDLMIYIIAMGSIYSYITWLDRLYGTFSVYSQMNSYIAKDLITTMGVDFNDLQQHMMDLKYYIDQITVRASAFCVPADLSIFSRWAFMYQNIYTDGDSPKCGYYFYNPSYFYQYQLDASQRGSVVPIPWFADNMPATFSDLVTYGNNLLNAIARSEDCGIMSGDILKAYGADKLIKLATVPFGYTIIPTYNLEVLEQIRNATLPYHNVDFTDSNIVSKWSVVQVGAINAYLGCQPYEHISTPANGMVINHKKLITSKFDPVEPLTTIVNTRLVASRRCVLNTDNSVDLLYVDAGSEIVTNMHVYLHGSYGGLIECTPGYASTSRIATDTVFTIIKHFMYVPELTLGLAWTGEIFTRVYTIFDVDNYSIIDETEIKNLHESALLSMFQVPLMGAYENK